MPKDNVTRKFLTHCEVVKTSHFVTENGNRALRTYLGNVEKGQPNVYTAPFAKGENISTVIKSWQEVLVSIKDKWPSLWDFENDLANKVGPMSVQKPIDDRIEDIAHYYDDILLSSKPVLSEAIKAVVQEFKPVAGLRLRSQARVVENMKLSTNSGVPFFTKRRNVVQDTIPCTMYDTDMHQELPHWYGRLAAVIGWRGQEGGMSADDVKQRVVWMFPMALNVSELQVYQPLIEGCQKHNLVPAWVSMESVDKTITSMFDTKDDDDLVVCTDFSKFDQHFNAHMQDATYHVLYDLLKGDARYDWLTDVFGIKYRIPLIIKNAPHGFVVSQGKHGMASGSGGTNADETLAHRALQYEAAILSGKRLNTYSQCLGDDGILTYPGITVEDVVKAYQSHGQVCNPDKQYAATQDCVYLRRWHHNKYRVNGICVGVYSTCRALGRLRYLERFMNPEYWSPQMVALRQLSILENCKWHPLREEFVRFCMKRDKYRLGIDIPGFLDNIVSYAIEATDHMPDFLGYTKTLQGVGPKGIATWWIVNYLKSLR